MRRSLRRDELRQVPHEGLPAIRLAKDELVTLLCDDLEAHHVAGAVGDAHLGATHPARGQRVRGDGDGDRSRNDNKTKECEELKNERFHGGILLCLAGSLGHPPLEIYL